MARSSVSVSVSRRFSLMVYLDRLALGGLGLGLVLYVMPFWSEGRLRLGFWLTLLSTVLHVYTSHARSPHENSPAPSNPEGPRGIGP